MLIKSVIALLATSALAMKLVQRVREKHQFRRVGDDQQRHREDVNRWEAEGGNPPIKPQR